MESPSRPQAGSGRRMPPSARPLVIGFLTVTGIVVLLVLFGSTIKSTRDQAPDLLALWPLLIIFPWGIGGLLLMNRDLRSLAAEQRRDGAREREILEQALPEAVPEAERRAAEPAFQTPEARAQRRRDLAWMAFFAVIFVLAPAAVLGLTGVYTLLADLRAPVLWAIYFVGAWLYFAFIRRFLNWKARRNGVVVEEPRPRLRFDPWRGVAGILFGAYLLLPLIGVWALCTTLLFGSGGDPAPALVLTAVPLALILTFALPVLLLACYAILPLVWALRPVKRGDYDGGLRRAEWLLRLHSYRGEWENFAGFVLYLAGRYDEAEQVLPSSIKTMRGELGRGGSDGLGNLGCVLAARGRYDEAVAMFEGSIGISPQQVGAYVDLAGTVLRMGGDAERALALTDRAWDNFRASRLRRWIEAYMFGFIWTERGWALAVLGRAAEARVAVERGIAGTDQSFLPELAGTYYYAARATMAMGDTATAIEYLDHASRLDPRGHYGRLAREAMSGSIGA